MPVTLAEARINVPDDVTGEVIDEFRKSSFLLDSLTFDDVVNPAGNGATLTYGYSRVVTPATAAFRAINAEYTPSEATKEPHSVDLKPLGGSFQIDRVLNRLAAAQETSFQMQQKIKSTRARFCEAVINGDTGTDANAFDGLDVALAGSSTEMNATSSVDWTGITSESDAQEAIELLDELFGLLDGEPGAILGNAKSTRKIKAIARRAGYFDRSRNDFGQTVERFGNVAIVDLGERAGSANPVIPIETRDVDGGGGGGNITGLTDLYVVRFGLDGFHGVSMAGAPLVQQWLPDFTTAGAVKTGEVELGPAAVVLKATKAAAVLRNVKVQ